jgi:putative transposase
VRSSQRYESRRDPQEGLGRKLKDLAATYVRYGYRRLTVLLKREGWKVNAKRIYRLYREEGLIVRTKQRKKMRDGSGFRPRWPHGRIIAGAWTL